MGASDIRTVADDTAKELEQKGLSKKSSYLIEEKRQNADLLMGWVARAKKEIRDGK